MKLLISVLFLLLCAFYVPSFSQADQFSYAKNLLFEARDSIYNFDNDDQTIESRIYLSRSIFDTIKRPRDRLYWLAQAEYFEGLYYSKNKNKKEAECHFVNCNSILIKCLKQCGEFSEAYSLLADSHMHLMLSKGFTYQILNGQKLKSFPEKALKLDSANTKAYQSLAVYWMNAPEALGGGIQKAIALLKKLSSKDKGDMFNIYYLLGNAYMKIHESVLASEYLQLALSIYPKNRWAEKDLETVRSRSFANQ